MLDLHPQYLKHNGEDTHVILTLEEYQAIQEALEDIEDYRLLCESKQQQKDEPTMTHEQVKAMLGSD